MSNRACIVENIFGNEVIIASIAVFLIVPEPVVQSSMFHL